MTIEDIAELTLYLFLDDLDYSSEDAQAIYATVTKKKLPRLGKLPIYLLYRCTLS